MTTHWFDMAAKRAATPASASGSRRDLFGDAATQLVRSDPRHAALKAIAVDTGATVSRRRGLKWAMGTWLAVSGASALAVDPAAAELTEADDYYITAVDEVLETNEVFGLIGAAIVFYEAAETLDSPSSSGACDPGSFMCGCANACLVDGTDCAELYC